MGKIKLRFDLNLDFKSLWIQDLNKKLRKSIFRGCDSIYVGLVIQFMPMRDLCQCEMQSKLLRAAPNFVLKQRNMSFVHVQTSWFDGF